MKGLSLSVHEWGAYAKVAYNPYMKDLFTRKDRFGVEYTVHRPTPEGTQALIPRGMVTRSSAKFDYTCVNPVPQSIAVVPPRNQEQHDCIQKCVALLHQGIDHIFEAPTGFGKSYVGASVAGILGQATLIVVTKSDLMDSWRKCLIENIGVPASQIGIARQDKLSYKGCKFVIAMLHTLVKRKYDPEFYRYFGLVVFDEVHRLGAEHFEEVCYLFPAKHRLGLSATPKRGDGKMGLIIDHIGPVLVRGAWVPMKPKVLAVRTKWSLPPEMGRDDHGVWTKRPMKVIPGRMANVDKAMGLCDQRNAIISNMAVQAYSAGRHLLILSSQIENHLRQLHRVLLQAGIPAKDIGYYISGMSVAEQEYTKTKARVVLATYGMTKEGTDVPHWDTLILATPLADVKQAIGRVLRYVEGKPQPIIFDLIDENPILQGFYFSRLKQYYEVGAQVVDMQ